MRKSVYCILCLMLAFCLAACGSSTSSVQSVESMISAIGEVSTESGNAIREARAAFDALPEKAQQKISNLAVLEDAEEKLDEVLAAEVEKLISKLENYQYSLIDDNAKIQIGEARAAFDALTDKQQKMVENAIILKNVESAANSPYGIPLYDSPEDVNLAVVLAKHQIKYFVDQFGGFIESEQSKTVYPGKESWNNTFYNDRYYFLDSSHWDEAQYVHYSISKPETWGPAMGSESLLVYNPALYNNEPYWLSVPFSEMSGVWVTGDNRTPYSAEAIESMLNGSFIPLSFDNYKIIDAKNENGMYRIDFEPADDTPIELSNADGEAIGTSQTYDCYVVLDPETSLIQGFGYERKSEYTASPYVDTVQTVSAEVKYGLDEQPDYSNIWAKVFQ